MARFTWLARAVLPAAILVLPLAAGLRAEDAPRADPHARVYSVTDLTGAGAQGARRAESLAAAVRRIALPANGEAVVAHAPVADSHALVVRADEEGHREVAALLDKLRRAIVSRPGDAPADRAQEDPVQKALARPFRCDLRQVPLDQAAVLIGHEAGIKIELDRKALAEAKIATETEVYPVSDLVGEGDQWIEADLEFVQDLTTCTIRPTDWEDVGGRGSIAAVSLGDFRALLVRQAPPVHREVAGLLGVLRRLVADADAGLAGEPLRLEDALFPGAKRVREALARPFSCDFRETPLDRMAADISQKAGVQVLLDRKALADVGIKPDTPLTFRIANISLRSALRHVLRDLDLTYVVQDECLLITAPEEAEARLLIHFYPVPDLVAARDAQGRPTTDFEPLVDLVTTAIAPSAWDEVGGPGSMAPGALRKARFLVVAQSQPVHEEIARLLADLRAVPARAERRAASRPGGGGPRPMEASGTPAEGNAPGRSR